MLGSTDRQRVESHIDLLRDANAGEDLARQHYAVESDLARQAFRAGLADTDFQAGLALSSSALFGNLASYRAPVGSRSRSRVDQVERGLLRYFSRASRKATPFGRFCTVVTGVFQFADTGSDEATQPVMIDAASLTKSGRSRLNKGIYTLFWDHLIRKPEVRQRLVLSRNTTADEGTESWRFLVNDRGREVFRRVAKSEALAAVVEQLSHLDGRSLEEVIQALSATGQFEGDHGELSDFVDALVDAGLLRLHAVVDDQEADWDRPLTAFLRTIGDASANAVVKCLDVLRSKIDDYDRGDALERSRALRAMMSETEGCLNALGIPGGVPRDLTLFEDATSDAQVVVRSTPGLDRALRVLGELCWQWRRIAHPRASQATMRHFFDQRYGERTAIPVLEFYEDFYREHKKELLSQEARARRDWKGGDALSDFQNPFGLIVIRRQFEAVLRMQQLIKTLWSKNPSAEELRITPAEMAFALSEVSDPPPECHSVAVFCQIIPRPEAGDEPYVVVAGPQLAQGYGKFLSRFAYILGHEFTERILADNERLTEDHLSEVAGDADFNANLHPPLLPYEIGYPTSVSPASGPRTQIACTDLEVRRHLSDPDALILVHRATGRRVLALDMGFMNPLMRPALYQLLTSFVPPGHVTVPMPDDLPRAPGMGARVTSRPRIVYDGAVVLARRRWTLDADAFPAQSETQSEVDYFISIGAWRAAHGIAPRVFVRVLAARPNGKPVKADEAPQRRSRDLHKPQYIDFESPLFVQLFARIRGPLTDARVVLEEALPDTEHLPRVGSQAFAYELVLHVDSRSPGLPE
jgi:hypothetical protein